MEVFSTAILKSTGIMTRVVLEKVTVSWDLKSPGTIGSHLRVCRSLLQGEAVVGLARQRVVLWKREGEWSVNRITGHLEHHPFPKCLYLHLTPISRWSCPRKKRENGWILLPTRFITHDFCHLRTTTCVITLWGF